jgi:hypothetical protein
LHLDAGLDVRVVSYGRSQPAFRALFEVAPSWADALFRETPVQWGSRGDPYLWRDLHAASRTVPQAPPSQAALADLLASQLLRLAGLDLRALDDDPVLVPRFPTSGMSGGHIAPAFWKSVAVPLLLDRWMSPPHGDPHH